MTPRLPALEDRDEARRDLGLLSQSLLGEPSRLAQALDDLTKFSRRHAYPFVGPLRQVTCSK